MELHCPARITGYLIHDPKSESLEQINLSATGLNVGTSEIYGCIPEGCSQQYARITLN